MTRAAPPIAVNASVPGSPVSADYGAIRGTSLEQGFPVHQVLAQSDGKTLPGKNDDFGVTSVFRPAGGRTPKRETVSKDTERGAGTPVRSGSGLGYRSTAAADHGE